MAEYVKKYATEDALRETDKVWKISGPLQNYTLFTFQEDLSSSSESSMSDFSEDEAKDMEL